MGYLTDLQKQDVEKISLVVVTPRLRHEGWTLIAANTYQTTFTAGVPVSMWSIQDIDLGLNDKWSRVSDIGSLAAFKFYFDNETKLLTIHATFDPDAVGILGNGPGMIVEFEVHVSTAPIYGRRDPLSSTFSDIVNWEPALISSPGVNTGSQNDIFGFLPSGISTVSIANNGWINELTYSASWNLAPIKGYIVTGSDYEKAVLSSGVVQIFSGYVNAISEDENVISLSCADYTAQLDKDFPTRQMAATFGTVNTADLTLRVPRLFGMADMVEPINLDYNAAPTTSNNRKWLTHDSEGLTHGNYTLTMDHLAANTATLTYFTTTPGLNAGDHIILNHASGVVRVTVVAVNRALKTITHGAIVRTVAAGETAVRYFVAAVWLVDRDGSEFNLRPGVDYNTFHDTTPELAGFTLVNNFEAALATTYTPFDPSQDKLYCRVYGTTDTPTYSDASAVGGISQASGVASDGVTVLARALEASGIDSSQWDKDTFEDAANNSTTTPHALGMMIPFSRGASVESRKTVIAKILNSQIWKLGQLTASDGAVRLGVAYVSPFPAPFDYSVDNSEFASISWEQIYADIYSDISATYKIQHASYDSSLEMSRLETQTATAENRQAKDLHLIDRQFSIELLQIDGSEAGVIADRLSFILGERRAIYKMKMPYTQLLNAKVGVNYQIVRDSLPGFAYAFDAGNARTLDLIEVQRDAAGVSLILDDQKGVQDHAGDW